MDKGVYRWVASDRAHEDVLVNQFLFSVLGTYLMGFSLMLLL